MNWPDNQQLDSTQGHARCPHCRQKYRIPMAYVGKRVRCARCRNAFTIAIEAEPAGPARPAAQASAPEPRPQTPPPELTIQPPTPIAPQPAAHSTEPAEQREHHAPAQASEQPYDHHVDGNGNGQKPLNGHSKVNGQPHDDEKEDAAEQADINLWRAAITDCHEQFGNYDDYEAQQEETEAKSGSR